MGDPLLLITGASGLLGGLWLPELSRTRRVVALTRSPENARRLDAYPGVTALVADLREPGLGIPDEQFRWLQRSASEVIHAAADVRFSQPLEESRSANTVSTANLLEFAAGCEHLNRFAYLSTTYVVGRHEGVLPEGAFCPATFLNSYEQSKQEAETLVLKAASRLPSAVFRLSSVAGDSRTGIVRQFNHVHQLVRLLPRRLLPVMPGDPGAPVDVIPTDWTMKALSVLYESAFEPGRVFHLCAGPAASATLKEVLEVAVRGIESHDACRRFLPVRVPRMINASTFEQFARFLGACNPSARELLRVLGCFLPHLALRQVFENTHTVQALEANGVAPAPPILTYWPAVVRYCLDTGWGRGAEV